MRPARTAALDLDVPLRTWALSLLLLPVCVALAANRGAWTVLDLADLIVHEAGHVLFRPFGFWMGLAGGTLLQLLLPGLLTWNFARGEYRPGAQLMLVWLGQSFVNASVYAADARARALPLLGGDTVLHDWHALLGAAGLLHADVAVGAALFALGVAAFGLGVALPAVLRTERDL